MDREEIARHRLEELDQRQQMERGLGGVKTSVDNVQRSPGYKLPSEFLPLPGHGIHYHPGVRGAYRRMELSATLGTPRPTSGATKTVRVFSGTRMANVLAFSTGEYAFWRVTMPLNYTGGPLLIESFNWTGDADAGKNVRWVLDVGAAVDGTALATMAYNSDTGVPFILDTDRSPAATNEFVVTKVPQDAQLLQPGESPSPGCDMFFLLTRTSAGNTYTPDAAFMALVIFYPTGDYFEYPPQSI